MEWDTHDPGVFLAVGIQSIELVRHRTHVLLARIAKPVNERHVVDVHAIGNREKLSGFYLHGKWLIVAVPIADVDDSLFGEEIERIKRFRKSRPKPAAG